MNLRELNERGLLASETAWGEATALLKREQDAENALPWIGRVALGIGAWLSGLFFSAFIMLFLIGGEVMDALILGVIIISGTTWLLSLKRGPFLEQLSLALCLSGHVLVFYGMAEFFNDELIGAFVAAAVLCGPVFWFSNHPVQRFLSVLWVWVTWWIVVVADWRSETLHAELMIYFALITVLVLLSGKLTHRMWGSARWASLVGLVGSILWISNGEVDSTDMVSKLPLGLITAVGFSALLFYLVQPEENQLIGFGLFSLLLVGLGLAGAPGIVSSIGLMAVAHARGDRRLAWAATGLLGLFLITFYYHLAIPLVQKSVILMISGAVLLGIRLLLFRKVEA